MHGEGERESQMPARPAAARWLQLGGLGVQVPQPLGRVARFRQCTPQQTAAPGQHPVTRSHGNPGVLHVQVWNLEQKHTG